MKGFGNLQCLGAHFKHCWSNHTIGFGDNPRPCFDNFPSEGTPVQVHPATGQTKESQRCVLQCLPLDLIAENSPVATNDHRFWIPASNRTKPDGVWRSAIEIIHQGPDFVDPIKRLKKCVGRIHKAFIGEEDQAAARRACAPSNRTAFITSNSLTPNNSATVAAPRPFASY